MDYRKYKYDVAISYESHSRDLVAKITDFLKSEKWEVYLDVDRQQEMVSENLESSLYQIYQNESLVKVLFVTERYLKSKYTLLEARRSFDSTRQEPRRLIVVNFVDELPQPYKSYVYLSGDLQADEIAAFIGRRIRELKVYEKEDAENENESSSRNTCKEAAEVNVNIVNNNNNGVIIGGQSSIGDINLRY